MKRMNQTIAFLLLTLTAAGSVACGDSQTDGKTDHNTENLTGTTEVQTEAVDPATVLEVPDMDWGGREFRVLAAKSDTYTQFSNFEIYAEGENGDLVNDAVYRRNMKIEERYNAKVTECLAPVTAFPDTLGALQKSVMASEDLYDLAFLKVHEIGTAAQNNYLYNLYDLPYIDFEKAWWNPEVNESLTIQDKLYFTSSDFSLRDKNRVYILVYNRDMAQKYDLGDGPQLVRDGKWTIDVAAEWSKAVANDVNGDGKYGIEDTYGLGFDSGNGFAALLYGMDNRILSGDQNGDPTIVMNTQHMSDSIDRALVFTESPVGTTCDNWVGKVDFDPWDTTSILFAREQLLFMTCFPSSLAIRSATCDFDYGVLPYPKYDESQKSYLTMQDQFGMLFGVPSTTQTPDFSAFMLEVLSAESEEVQYKYYEVACKVKYTYDEASAEMLDLIFDNIVYDFGFIYDIGLYALINDTVPTAKKNSFASSFAKKESAAQKKLDKILEAFSQQS